MDDPAGTACWIAEIEARRLVPEKAQVEAGIRALDEADAKLNAQKREIARARSDLGDALARIRWREDADLPVAVVERSRVGHPDELFGVVVVKVTQTQIVCRLPGESDAGLLRFRIRRNTYSKKVENDAREIGGDQHLYGVLSALDGTAPKLGDQPWPGTPEGKVLLEARVRALRGGDR